MKGIYCDGNLTCKTGDIVHYHTAILEGKSDDLAMIAKKWITSSRVTQSRDGNIFFKISLTISSESHRTFKFDREF